MNNRETYEPGPASGARIQKDGEKWTLVLVRELRHSPAKVWRALTDPAELSGWAPFDASRSLSAAGPVTLSTVGTPSPMASESTVKRADAPHLLEFDWGGNDLRWELEPSGIGTRLTLWHSIDRRYIAMGAAGWQICLDVLDRLLDNAPIGRIAGKEAMQHGWPRLYAEYSAQFGIEDSVGAPPAQGEEG